ncbi:hypothetical protein GCM10009839_71710 [Catenulispora yoronensis]|uniref:HTH araC/xylS-type domain-containing protein n=1 Tax=Catenulispora yoronensis TaxID=450799 RepID=A0ABP5GPP7_9ACTN
MENTVERAAERAITTMRARLGEQVTVDDMARAAMFSKFHFTRIFLRATGTSPARFLSALRLQKAKHLLVSTDLNVVDISILVGYNSVGTFSSRFSRSVGLSPTAFRKRGGYTDRIPVREPRGPVGLGTGTVQGKILPYAGARHGLVFVGLFPERLPEGRPVRCAVLDRPMDFTFDGVPPGSWYLLAQSVSPDAHGVGGGVGHGAGAGRGIGHGIGHAPGAGHGPGPGTSLPPRRGRDPRELRDPRGPQGARELREAREAALSSSAELCVGSEGPIVVRNGAPTPSVDLALKPAGVLDPPVLLALLDARKEAIRRTAVGAE